MTSTPSWTSSLSLTRGITPISSCPTRYPSSATASATPSPRPQTTQPSTHTTFSFDNSSSPGKPPSLLQPLLRPHLETLPIQDLEATQGLCRTMMEDSLPESVEAHNMAKPREEWDVIDFMHAPTEDDWLPKDEWQFAEDLLRVAIAAKKGPLQRERERKLWEAYGFDVEEVRKYQVMA